MLRGASVFVTGAGGSIGSALSLQLIAQGVKTLILYDSSEYALYQVEQKARAFGSRVKIVAVLGDLSSVSDLKRLFRLFRVDLVYHAAAFKHVPMVERNVVAGVLNNVFGTCNLVQAAREAEILKLCLVSTDKAVRPASVMGATKWLAEQVTRSAGYRAVRFGNVLGSTGSVVPLFCSQLLNGGLVTVTHPEVSRYFMSVCEAVGLILQSECIGASVAVLDMGEEIRIAQLAQRLAGLLSIDLFEIQYVGLRPGEKLHEELTLGFNLHPSRHPMILTAREPMMGPELNDALDELGLFCASHDVGAIREFLQRYVPEYRPACGIVDQLWLEENVWGAEEKLGDCYRIPDPVEIRYGGAAL